MRRHARPLAAILTGGLLLLVPAPLAAQAAGPGLLGQRMYGFDPGLEHFDSARLGNALGAAASVNLPVLPGLDAALSYSAAHLGATDRGRTPEVLSVTAVDYTDAMYGKSYVAVTVGHAWDIGGLMGVTETNADSFWEVGTGIEVTYGHATSINYGVAYSASFDRNGRNPAWRYSVLASHWFTRRLAGVIGVSYRQIRHAPDSLIYLVGVRVAF